MQKLRETVAERDYYLNFEDDRLVEFTLADFQQLLEIFVELYGPQKTFYFDEIQNIPEWERFIRRLHEDANKVYITGSNATLLSQELGTKLTGRYVTVTVYPYSFREYCFSRCPELIDKSAFMTDEKGMIKQIFSQYVRLGGIPEYVKFENLDYLHSLYESILYRDIIARYKLPQDTPLKKLAYYLASHVGKEITFNALRKAVQLSSPNTASDYCRYLQNSFLSYQINRFSASLKEKNHYAKKQYFVDHALAKAIGFRLTEDRGRLFENIVFMELLRRKKEVYFYRDIKECDFIVKQDNSIVMAMQVSADISAPETREREITGLLEAVRCYQLAEGTLITEDYESEETVDNIQIHIIPLWRWLLQR